VTKLIRPPASAAVCAATLCTAAVLVRSPIDDDEEELTNEGGYIYHEGLLARGEKGRVSDREREEE